MAERGFTPITVQPLFKPTSLSAGDSGTSAAVDLRYAAQQGKFSIASTIAAGTSTTCGTTIFKYLCATSLKGAYFTPGTAGTIGTIGPTIGSDLHGFTPPLTPFIKIVATQTGAGTAGANSKVSADLIIQ